MMSTNSAAATGLPHPRRAFLRQLASLPLIGGGVALVGQPSAVADPATPDMLEAYKTWLAYERRELSWEMAADPAFTSCYPSAGSDRIERFRKIDRSFMFVGDAGHYHFGGNASPYTRAALVLSAVGCAWREDPQ